MLDLAMLIVCFLISCAIWIYVTGIENGEFEYTFQDVTVNIDGASALLDEQGLSLVTDQEYKVDITVKGYRREIMKYSADDFFAHIEVDTINGAGTHSLNVLAESPAGNVTIVASTPSVVNVFVDETVTKSVPIQTALRYNIADTLTMHEPVPEVDTVELIGPKSRVELIEYAMVEYDLGTVTTSTNFKASIKLCDDLGNEVFNPYIKTSISEVAVKIKVTCESAVMLVPEYAVSDADQYEYNIIFEPETITVVGDPSVVSKLDKITVKLGDVTKVQKGSVGIATINLPEGVSPVEEKNGKNVSYTVEKTVKENNS